MQNGWQEVELRPCVCVRRSALPPPPPFARFMGRIIKKKSPILPHHPHSPSIPPSSPHPPYPAQRVTPIFFPHVPPLIRPRIRPPSSHLHTLILTPFPCLFLVLLFGYADELVRVQMRLIHAEGGPILRAHSGDPQETRTRVRSECTMGIQKRAFWPRTSWNPAESF